MPVEYSGQGSQYGLLRLALEGSFLAIHNSVMKAMQIFRMGVTLAPLNVGFRISVVIHLALLINLYCTRLKSPMQMFLAQLNLQHLININSLVSCHVAQKAF
jgi:hypothetical protein